MKLLAAAFILCFTITSAIPFYKHNFGFESNQLYLQRRNGDIYAADMFRELRDILRDNTEEIFKKKVEEYFGKETELSKSLIDALKEEGKVKVLNFFNRLIGDEEVENSEESDIRNSDIYGSDMFRELRDILRDNANEEIFKKKVEEYFGKETELTKSLIEALEEEGKIKVINFFNRLIGDEEVDKSAARFIANADFNFLEIFKKLKNLIKDKVDSEKLKEQIEKLFGKESEMAEQLLDLLKTKGDKGKKKILDFIDRILGVKEEEKRSIKDVWEKIKDYFKDLNIELKEKFTKFGEHVKEEYQKGLEKGKTRAENIRKIAQQFLKDGKHLSKEIADEALGFFREHKEDLGDVFEDIKAKVREILKKNQ